MFTVFLDRRGVKFFFPGADWSMGALRGDFLGKTTRNEVVITFNHNTALPVLTTVAVRIHLDGMSVCVFCYNV